MKQEKSSKAVLLEYLEKREVKTLTDKIARKVGLVGRYCGNDGWNYIIAEKIVAMLKKKYLFVEKGK